MILIFVRISSNRIGATTPAPVTIKIGDEVIVIPDFDLRPHQEKRLILDFREKLLPNLGWEIPLTD